MFRHPALVAVALGLAVLASCTVTDSQKGVKNHWRDADQPAFATGATTRAQVLEALGPPSQVLPWNEGQIFYYLLEAKHSESLILLVYNRTDEMTRYDRAIFFFDGDGVLQEFSLSREAIE